LPILNGKQKILKEMEIFLVNLAFSIFLRYIAYVEQLLPTESLASALLIIVDHAGTGIW